MELEDVSEKIDWETRRIAAAFGVKEWVKEERDCNGKPYCICCGTSSLGQRIEWHINHRRLLSQILIDDEATLYWTGDHRPSKGPPGWLYWQNGQYDGIMARGLYRLGFEEEDVLSMLPEMTMHEKMELRLSLPREFWPQTWLEEEATGGR